MHALLLEKNIIHKRYTGNQHAKVKTREARQQQSSSNLTDLISARESV